MKYLNDIIREVAQRINDKDFEDFTIEDYVLQYRKASIDLSRKYQIFLKGYSFKLSDVAIDNKSDIILDLPDYKVETDVFVNDRRLLKVNKEIKPVFQYVYYLEYIDQQLHFNYILGNKNYDNINIDEDEKDESAFEKNMNDEVYIIYQAIPDKEGILESYYIFPEMYKEELITTLMVYLSKTGMVKYATSDKIKKFQTIYQLYNKEVANINPDNTKLKEFIILQPWSVI